MLVPIPSLIVCCNALGRWPPQAQHAGRRGPRSLSGVTPDLSRFVPSVKSCGFHFTAAIPANYSTDSVSNSTTRRVSQPGSVNKGEPRGVKRREEKNQQTKSRSASGDNDDGRPVRRSVYQHCTFCSLCGMFRRRRRAVAKCEACPRILCGTCAGRKGEAVPLARNAEDVVLSADKCLCRSKDSEFPKPPPGVDPKAHLLKHLRRHDLSRMFREPVDVEDAPGYLGVVPREDMMDLGTLERRMVNRKEYQSSRGQKRFRSNVKKIWTNCRTYAGYSSSSESSTEDDEIPGIVRCTIILEAMTQRFYANYMREENDELVSVVGSRQTELDHRKDNSKRFNKSMPSRGGVWSHDVLFGATEPSNVDSEKETTTSGMSNENYRIRGTVVGRKRKCFLG